MMKGVFLPFFSNYAPFFKQDLFGYGFLLFFSVRTVNKRSSATLRTLSELEQKSFPKPTGGGALNKNNRFLCDSTLPLLVKTYQKRIRKKARESPSIGNHTSTPQKWLFFFKYELRVKGIAPEGAFLPAFKAFF